VKKNIHGFLRVIYLATPDSVSLIKNELLKLNGTELLSKDPIKISITAEAARQAKFKSISQDEIKSGTIIHFFSDPLKVAAELPNLEVDLFIIDERLRFLNSEINQEVASQKLEVLHTAPKDSIQSIPITFESVERSIKKFTPRNYHYPARRILVVIPNNLTSAKRSFDLGLANVRGVIVEPKNALELIIIAAERLYSSRAKKQKNNLTVGGGGLDGYIYALGVSHALNRSIEGNSLNDFDIFCGVSSGAILSSCLAAGISTHDLILQLYKKNGILEPLTVGVVFDLAAAEVGKRAMGLLKGRHSMIMDTAELVGRLESAVPVGFFKGEKLKQFIQKNLSLFGVEDNFTALKKELYISATDQDTCEHITFGEEPWKDIKISQAVRASTALPPFYLPEKINGHWFTDGQLTSTADFELAIKKQAGFVIMIDPMVAYSSFKPGSVIERGGFFACVQAVKSLVQTRTEGVLRHVMDNSPDVDFLVFQPTNEVMEAMAGVPMRYQIRSDVAELSFRGTLGQILSNYQAIAHRFSKHGIVLKSKEDIEREQKRGLGLT